MGYSGETSKHRNIEALALTVQKLLARIDFQAELQNYGTECQTGQKQPKVVC